MRAFGVLAAVFAKILQVAAAVEHLADGDRHRVLPRDVGEADDQIAEHRQRRRGPAAERALLEPAHEARPERVGGQRRLQPGREQREVSGRVGVVAGAKFSTASMTPLPMPRAGTLITRRRLTSSCGLMTSRM